MTKLERAKKGSLDKWRGIRYAYPNVDSMYVLLKGDCAFCAEYTHEWSNEEEFCECPLRSSVCGTSDSLYFLIYLMVEKMHDSGVKKTRSKKLKENIDDMIKAIEKVKE